MNMQNGHHLLHCADNWCYQRVNSRTRTDYKDAHKLSEQQTVEIICFRAIGATKDSLANGCISLESILQMRTYCKQSDFLYDQVIGYR